MRALPWGLTAAALCLSPSLAEAGGDDVYGNRGASQMSERGHEIELSMDRGHASLRVRRTVHNAIERHDEAQFWINIPSGSVATGLRTLGEFDGRPHWFAGELLEAEAAAARYQELTGVGGYYPKDPALLSWRDAELLALQVFPVAPGTDKTVEYTLDMPARWEGGRWHLELPSLGTDAMPAEVWLRPAQDLDQLFVDGEVVARGHWLTLEQGVEIALAPRDPEPVSLSLASVDTGTRHLARWQLTLAPEISTIPTGARLVLILDLSRSISAAELDSQRTLAMAMLEHFRDPALGAEVALLGVDREVHALSQGFVTAAEAITALESAALQQRNGSELGLALAEADRLLGAGPKRGARRILMLTDFETASRLGPSDLQAHAEHSGAIVHLARVSDGSASLERDDLHAFADVAASTQGVLWSASAPSAYLDPSDRDYNLAVFEELARPVRVDELRIRVDGLSFEDDLEPWSSYEHSLVEGEGIEGLQLSLSAGRELTVEGKTWNHPIHHSAKPSKAEGDRWSALVFGSELLWELSEDEMMVLAMRGGAVSPVTSYLAIEPGVRPSTEGLEAWESGDGFGSAFGIGGLGLRGVGSGGGGAGFDKQGWLEAELGEGWRRCGGQPGGASLTLETQTHELLDVGLSLSSADAGLRACAERVAWSLQVPQIFVGFETWTVQL